MSDSLNENGMTEHEVLHKDGTETVSETITQAEVAQGPVVSSEAIFRFREPSKEAKATGKVKREEVKLNLPYLTLLGLLNALDDAKQQEYIINIVNDRIFEAAREQVNDSEKPVNTQDQLDLTKLTLEYLANETTERKTSGISKEDWVEFKADYIKVMPELTQKPLEKVEKAATLFVARLQPVKTSKPILTALEPMLDTWFGSKTTDEDKAKWAAIYEFLKTKLGEFLSVTDESLLESIV